MKPLSIQGIGILSARGRGIAQFEKALNEGWIAPALSAEGRPAFRISANDLIDREALKDARRADRFSKMTVLAAYDAVKDSGEIVENIRGSTGIIIASAMGPHATIFKFLDGVIDYGDGNVSPTTFAHSIHNSAASYVAATLGFQGPAMTITSFYFAFQQALQLAYAWLNEERVKQVLVGVSEECSTAMEYICAEKLSIATGGKMNPLSCAVKPETVPGEGSVFFLVSLDPNKKKYGAFSEVVMAEKAGGWNDVNLSILSLHGMAGSEKIYESVLPPKAAAAAYSNVYGGILSAGAFECAAAALMLKNQIQYASPVVNDVGPFKTNGQTAAAPLKGIQCVSHNCEGEFAFVKVVS